jgi:hypothetical protein
MKRITSADLAARLQTGSMQQPTEAVVVTHDDKDLFVMLPVETYVRLQVNDSPDVEELGISDADLDTIEWNR